MAVPVPEDLREQLVAVHNELRSEGKVIGEQAIREYQARFRERFGPEALVALDGKDLLDTMHNHSTRDSLVYWLEFKNDDEFRTDCFGGIGGGSALNYKIYRRKETGEWITGSPQHQKPITVDEAILIARRHRDQLIQASRALAELPPGASDEQYLALQHRLAAVAPDVSDTAWGHKYLSLLYPDKLDDFHSELWQRFYLVKLLQEPPPHGGRYVAAGRYVRLATHFGWPMTDLTAVLKGQFGSPHRYWAFNLGPHAPPGEVMRDRQIVALGFPALGDLSWLTPRQESIASLAGKISAAYPSLAQEALTLARQMNWFVTRVSERDIVVVVRGQDVLGIGRVAGGYMFSGETDFPHRVPVEWLAEGDALRQVNLNALGLAPMGETALLSRIGDHRAILQIERLSRVQPPPPPPDGLRDIPRRIQDILERKGQVILYGPPGTGKTYWAEWTARELAARHAFGKPFGDLASVQKEEVVGSAGEAGGLVRMCCFHPAFGYEDFIEGYRPQNIEGQLSFTLQDGIFKRLCRDAAARPDRRFYLVIDEINRGDIPRIFGELLTVLEKSRRSQPILLPLSGEILRVPENVYIISTMNTADRSIALLDTALRRRFGFIELMPDPGVLADAVVEGIPLGRWLEALNERICEHIGRDARNLQIGHSYLLHRGRPVTTFEQLVRVLRDDILPLLQEYCYEDYATLENILGNRLVDLPRQRFREEPFDPNRKEELLEALRAIAPDIITSPEAIRAEAEAAEEDEN
ncbi:MAG: AAA family ATPase [Bacillota bacterium]|nr:AAA family ATPase [Bacillota bacterium]